MFFVLGILDDGKDLHASVTVSTVMKLKSASLTLDVQVFHINLVDCYSNSDLISVKLTENCSTLNKVTVFFADSNRMSLMSFG